MSSSTVLKKGAPSRSYPSRQRKLGPAPFASFEDLSDELESPSGDQGASAGGGPGPSSMVQALPGIEEDDGDIRPHKSVTATSSGSTVTFAVSQPTSGLQTPSTPRIDISCASSSTPPSEESESEKELFQGGLGFAFHEEGTEELRSSTEELDLGGEVLEMDSEEERRQKKREKEAYSEDIYRRASTPANIFYRRKSSNTMANDDYGADDDIHRKPSAHTLFLDGLLSRPTARHRGASFGSGDYGRPGALSSMSAHSSGSIRGRSRSPSPHKMMLETSFCGCKPIPTKSMDVPDDSSSSSSKVVTKPQEQGEVKVAKRSPKVPIKIKPPSTDQDYPPPEEKSARSLSIKSLTAPSTSRSPDPPSSPTTSSTGGGDSRRPSYGRRSVSPFKMVYETSFCGSKPIPTKSMEVPDSPPKNKDGLPNDQDLSAFLLSQTTAQVHSSTSPRPLSPSSPKSSDHWRPITPKSESELSPFPQTGGQGVSEESSPSISTSTAKYVSTPNPNLKLQTSNIFKWPETKKADEVTNEIHFSEPPSSLPVEDACSTSSMGGGMEEAKFLQSEFDTEAEVDADDYEDGDLPYIPTTLPQEKPSTELVFPSKERRSSEGLTPLQRPKVIRPPNPASLNDYIAYASGSGSGDKMKINLPREDSLGGGSASASGYVPVGGGVANEGGNLRNSSPGKKKGSIGATNWADFAEMGLRSPRELRKKLREENGESD